MGTYKDEEEKSEKLGNKESEKTVKTYITCLWSFFVSMVGGSLLAWWDYEYHPTNSQQWMVPIGLILFVTPVMASFAVVVSETCNNFKADGDSRTSEPIV